MDIPVLLQSVIIVAGLCLLIAVVEGIRHLFSFSREFSRKAVHFLIAVPVLLLPVSDFHRSSLIAVPSVFIPVLIAAIYTGRLQPLHAERRSFGTVFYAMSFLTLVLLFYPADSFYLVLPMLILCIGDSLAAFPGEHLSRVHFYRPVGDWKTVEGSVVMGLVSFLLAFLLTGPSVHAIVFDGALPPFSRAESLVLAFLIGLLSSLVEALSLKGSDNLSIPLTAAVFLFLFRLNPTVPVTRLLFSGILSSLLGILSVRMKLLNGAGAMAMVILGVFLYGLGGFFWTVPLLVFFGSAGILSVVNRRRKSTLAWETEKGHTRDALQVFANGGIPLLMFGLHRMTGHQAFLFGFLAGAAAAAADTWATEVGVFSRSRPVGILNLKPLERGMSGGISFLGSFAAMAGSAVTVLAGWPLVRNINGADLSFEIFAVAALCGFLGAFIDSLLGASLQGTYRCSVCGRLTEKRIHCDTDGNPLVSGVAWMTNDMVNFSSFTIAGVIAVAIGFLVSAR